MYKMKQNLEKRSTTRKIWKSLQQHKCARMHCVKNVAKRFRSRWRRGCFALCSFCGSKDETQRQWAQKGQESESVLKERKSVAAMKDTRENNRILKHLPRSGKYM